MSAQPPRCLHVYCPSNFWDFCLLWQEAALGHAVELGGIPSCCVRPGMPRYAEPPHLVMPPQGRRYQYINTVPLPAEGSTVDVVDFTVPYGWDGVIVGLVNRFIGVGFEEGSGDLAWGLMLGPRYARDYGRVTTSIGDLTSSSRIAGAIRIHSGQRVRYRVYVAPGAHSRLDPSGRVLCAVFGWIYPRP